MMEYKLTDGSVVDDDDLEKMAQEWEGGNWKGHLENVTVNLSDSSEREEQTLVSFRIPRSRIKAIESAVEKRGITKSEFYRMAVDHELASMA